MQERKNRIMTTLQWILWSLMVVVILYFILGEIFMPHENMYMEGQCNTFNDGWVWVKPDGEKQEIEIPGGYDVPSGDTMVIQKELSRGLEDTWVCIRSSQQDMKIYIGEELREEYTTKDTRPFGKNSVSVYVFFPLYDDDAGKILRIEMVSNSPYSGYVNEMYEGERSDIWKKFFLMYLPGTLTAFFMMLLSFAVVCYSNIIHYAYKKRMEILYLGSGLLMASVWLLAESRLRQVIFPNSTIASNVGFFVVMLLPYPFLTYGNLIQNRRYQWIYMAIAVISIINFVTCTTLQFLNIYDFSETMYASHTIIIVLFIVLFVTGCIDAKKGYIKDYFEVAIGLCVVMIAGFIEIYQVYVRSSLYNGVTMCISMVVLVAAAVLKTGRDMFAIEKEKQSALIANDAKTRFLSNMSHEIRTPINTVVGMNEMILRESKEANIREYATNIHHASRMLLSLINDVLDFSKIEAGKLEVTEASYQLSSILNDVIIGIKVRAQEKDLELKLEIDEKLPSILRGDEIRIKQIMNNLLTNALKYTEKGTITLLVNGKEENDKFTLVISVADTGMGIQKEDMERLFDSFQRLDMEKNRYIQGTGLGLSITKQLVNQMKGSIDVQSEPGKGSCFTIHIPQQIVDREPMGDLQRAYRDATIIPSQDAEQEEKKYLYAPNSSVLVVDDNKMNLMVVKALLKRSAIRLDSAMSGDECLELTRQKKFDLILMDHMMPEPDGVETLHLLRAEENNPNKDTTVVVLTANAIAGAAEQYMKEGFADYLAKPVVGEKLEEVLAKYLKNEA